METIDPAALDFPSEFNLCRYYLDHNLEAGRADKVALVQGKQTRTYGQVSERAARVAAALRHAGVRPEERVLIVLPDGFAFAEAFFGVLRAGALFAMVNPLLKRADFEYYLRYTKARVAIVHASVLEELAPAAAAASPLGRGWAATSPGTASSTPTSASASSWS